MKTVDSMKLLDKVILFFSLTGFLYCQSDYSLQDINPNSSFYGDSIGTSYFENHIVIHYFGYFY